MNTIGGVRLLFSPDNNMAVVRLPEGARIVNLSVVGDELRLWAQGNTESPKTNRYFQAIMPGSAIPDGSFYVETIATELPGGMRVVHIYEVPGEVYQHWMDMTSQQIQGSPS